jgi:DNA polymerase-1
MKTPFVILTLAEAAKQLDKSLPLFADTETVGLYGKVRLLQLYQEHLEHVLLVEWPQEIEMLAMMDAYTQVYHNAHYDVTVMQEHSGIHSFRPKSFEDTFLLSRLAIPDKEKYSLDDVMGYVLGYDPYERQHLNKKALQKSDWSKRELTQEQLLYAATDVYYMPAVYDACKHMLDDTSYKLDKFTLQNCWKIQWNGMPVDHSRLNARYAENEQAIAAIDMPINANSWQQVRKWLDCTESDDLALATMEIQGNERAGNIRKVRKLRKQQSFLDKFRQERIFGKFKPSARSGRLTSDDQNLQQLPRALKGVFGFQPGEGKVLVYADYAQLELRTICAITNCLAMAKIFREGGDLHNYTAELIYGKDFTKQHRQISKSYNFTLLYGGGISMVISYMIKTAMLLLPEHQVNQDRKKWRRTWREIYAWQESGISSWRKGRLGSTPMGRKYKAKMMTDQLNIENQGAGAEVSKLAFHYFMKRDMEEAKVCNFIHDSFIIECDDDPEVYKRVATALAEDMATAWAEMSGLFAIKDLPMPVNVMVGYNWGDIEDEDVANIWDYELDGMWAHAKV